MSLFNSDTANNSIDLKPLSYYTILDDIQRYKQSGGASSDAFNFFDSPAHKYYKIFFYFGSKSEVNPFNINDNNFELSGLLAPTWNYENEFLDNIQPKSIKGNVNVKGYNNITTDGKKWYTSENSILNNIVDNNVSKYYWFNSAYAYLKLNGEDVYAERLKNFIELLSNININSPWYFSSVTGINEALTRKTISEGKPEFSERRKISISCLPDAFDNRISNLLDLYRSCVWDWKNKREVIPANLRKFDMAIYIFEAPDQSWHKTDQTRLEELGSSWASALETSLESAGFDSFAEKLRDESNNYVTINTDKLMHNKKDDIKTFAPSFKLIEFHDCEFDYNNASTAWATLDNKTGVTPNFNIDITFGDCYELTYNEFLMEEFGDVMKNSSEAWKTAQTELLSNRLSESSYTDKIIDGALGRINNAALSIVKRLAFGNLFGFSLTNLATNISSAIQNPMVAYDIAKDFIIDKINDSKQTNGTVGSNLRDSNKIDNKPTNTNIVLSSNIFEDNLKQTDSNSQSTNKSSLNGVSLFEAYTKSKAKSATNSNKLGNL